MKQNTDQTIHWLNLFVPLNQLSEAKKALIALQEKYPAALIYRPIYEWQVTYISNMPPLLYDKKESFIALGIWGNESNQSDHLLQLKKLQNDFSLLVKQKNYRRYIQTELANSPETYSEYFSKKTLSAFRKIKTNLDPEFLFNKNSFFK